MRLEGRVESGRGDCARWIERLAEPYRRVTGVTLYPGTLNVRLRAPFRMPPGTRVLDTTEHGGGVRVFVLPCRFEGLEAFVLRTEANEAGRGDHPPEVVEVAAAVCLRERFGLVDGDAVSLEVEGGPAPG